MIIPPILGVQYWGYISVSCGIFLSGEEEQKNPEIGLPIRKGTKDVDFLQKKCENPVDFSMEE